MNKVTTNKMSVVKIYHRLINKKTGYANYVCVGFLHFLSIFSLAFEMKLKIGCGKALHIAFPNRQGVALLILDWRIIRQDMSICIRTPKRASLSRATNVVQTPVTGSLLGVRPRGLPSLCLLAPLEKRKQTY